MTSRTAGVALVVALLVACAPGRPSSDAAGTAASDAAHELPVLPIGGDFTLTDQDGTPFALSSLEGKVVLIFFGYTMCPDACPTTLSKLSSAYARLSEDERPRVKAVYITIDPERDTPAVMKDHLTYFGVDAIGLTGTVEDTTRVAAQFGAHFEKTGDKTAAGYLMSHTVSIFGLDALGQTRLLIDYEASVDLVVKEIRALLAAHPALAQPTPSTEAEAQQIFREVMSPFCPGLTLADCPSQNAFMLRDEIEARLKKGDSRAAILDELVGEYGTQILADPSDTPMGAVVWGVPFALAALAAAGLALLLRRATRPREPDTAGPSAEPSSLHDRMEEELAALD